MARRRQDKTDHKKHDHHHHDGGHKHKHHHHKGGDGSGDGSGTGTGDGSGDGSVTEDIKAQSTQTGQDAMNAAPGSYPADPANADAVYTTGPGQAIEYNYVRVNGTGSDNYTPLQSSFTAPVPQMAGHGQVLTPAAAGEVPDAFPSGAENNPT